MGKLLAILKNPLAMIAGVLLIILSALKILAGAKKSGKDEAENDMQDTVNEQRAKAEADDVELLKSQDNRRAEHEKNVRNGASPFIDD